MRGGAHHGDWRSTAGQAGRPATLLPSSPSSASARPGPLGNVFQLLAIAPMRGVPLGKGLAEAAKADVASLTAFVEIDLFGWMAVTYFALFPVPHHLPPASAACWFLMQAGMIAGFFTARPVNAWLIRAGIKEVM